MEWRIEEKKGHNVVCFYAVDGFEEGQQSISNSADAAEAHRRFYLTAYEGNSVVKRYVWDRDQRRLLRENLYHGVPGNKNTGARCASKPSGSYRPRNFS